MIKVVITIRCSEGDEYKVIEHTRLEMMHVSDTAVIMKAEIIKEMK